MQGETYWTRLSGTLSKTSLAFHRWPCLRYCQFRTLGVGILVPRSGQVRISELCEDLRQISSLRGKSRKNQNHLSRRTHWSSDATGTICTFGRWDLDIVPKHDNPDTESGEVTGKPLPCMFSRSKCIESRFETATDSDLLSGSRCAPWQTSQIQQTYPHDNLQAQAIALIFIYLVAATIALVLRLYSRSLARTFATGINFKASCCLFEGNDLLPADWAICFALVSLRKYRKCRIVWLINQSDRLSGWNFRLMKVIVDQNRC